MSEPFLSEIKLVSFILPPNDAPKGWALCNGQLLQISQNQALFSLLGTTYGGDGRVNFALPNLQGRVPVHYGTAPNGNVVALGEQGGEASHTLSLAELPSHEHLQGSLSQASLTTPVGNVLASKRRGGVARYTASGAPVQINDGTVAVGASQAHENTQPYLTLSYIIALQGIFPSRT